MKTSCKFLAATAVLLGLAACSKVSEMEDPEYKAQENLVPITLGASFADTKTAMDDDSGNVIWLEGDQISVQVGSNNYIFTLESGAGSNSGTFSALVTESDAKIIAGTDAGTVSACYPTSGASVPTSQAWAEGTFADETFPMTATKTSGSTLTFTTDAAVVRVQNVSATATKAVLSYTVSSTNYSVTMDLTAGDTAKDLYFVIVPGAQTFSLKLDDAAAVEYSASAATAAGSRYNLTAPVAQIGDTKYATLTAAVAAVPDGGAEPTILEIISDFTITDAAYNVDNKNIKIKGNNHTITATKTNAGGVLFDIDSQSKVDIEDLSIIADGYAYALAYDNDNVGATGTLTNVSVTSYGIPIGACGQSTTLTLNNVTSQHQGPKPEALASYTQCAVAAMGMATINIEGGEYTSDNFGAYVFTSGGTINISNSTVTAPSAFKCDSYNSKLSTINVDGGTYSGKADVANNWGSSGTSLSIINLKAGTFNNFSWSTEQFQYGWTEYVRVDITGGTYDVDPTQCVVAGYAAKAQGTDPETWTVVEDDPFNTKVTSAAGLTTAITNFNNAEDDGAYTIELAAGDYAMAHVDISQKAGKQLTIAAAKDAEVNISYSGSDCLFKVNSNSSYAVNANIKFKDLNFSTGGANALNVGDASERYVNDIDFINCTFTCNSGTPAVASPNNSQPSGFYFENCVVTAGSGYLYSGYGNNQSVARDYVVKAVGCTAPDCYHFINAQNNGPVILEDCNVTARKDYIVRTNGGNITVSESQLSSTLSTSEVAALLVVRKGNATVTVDAATTLSKASSSIHDVQVEGNYTVTIAGRESATISNSATYDFSSSTYVATLYFGSTELGQYENVSDAVTAYNNATEAGSYLITVNAGIWEVLNAQINQSKTKSLTIQPRQTGDVYDDVTLKLTGEEESAVFTINGISDYNTLPTVIDHFKFDLTESTGYCYGVLAMTGNNVRYTSNLTVSYCDFVGNGGSGTYYCKAGGAGSNCSPSNITFNHCTIEKMFSLWTGYLSNNAGKGITVTNCSSSNSNYFVCETSGDGSIDIASCDVTVDGAGTRAYAVRYGGSSVHSGGVNINVSNSKFTGGEGYCLFVSWTDSSSPVNLYVDSYTAGNVKNVSDTTPRLSDVLNRQAGGTSSQFNVYIDSTLKTTLSGTSSSSSEDCNKAFFSEIQ